MVRKIELTPRPISDVSPEEIDKALNQKKSEQPAAADTPTTTLGARMSPSGQRITGGMVSHADKTEIPADYLATRIAQRNREGILENHVGIAAKEAAAARNEAARARADVTQMEAEKAAVETSSSSEIASLTEKLGRAERNLARAIDAARNDSGRLNDRIKKMDQMIGELKTGHAGDKRAAEQALRVIQKNLEEETSAREDLEARLAGTETQLGQQRDLAARAEAKAFTLEPTISSQEDLIQGYERDIQNLRGEKATADAEIAGLKNRLRDMDALRVEVERQDTLIRADLPKILGATLDLIANAEQAIKDRDFERTAEEILILRDVLAEIRNALIAAEPDLSGVIDQMKN